jgi:two-component system sensor histidine kinase YcbA
VSTRAEQRDGHTEGYWISVRDNGPGIEEEDLDNLFLEGYSTKFDLRTGNILRGLGLCLVKDFVENDFHGRIEIDTQVGKYTDFRIWIPEEMTREVGM